MRKTVRTLIALVIAVLVAYGLWQLLSDSAHEDTLARPVNTDERPDPAGTGQPPVAAAEPAESKPFVAQDEQPPTPASPPRVTILVQDAQGVAVPGAAVVLAEGAAGSASEDEEGVLSPEGVTDESGRVTMEAPLGLVWAVAVKTAYPPAFAAIADEGVTVVQLSSGGLVEGVVTLDGRPATQPIEIELRGHRDVSVDWTLRQQTARARAGYVRGDVIPAVTDDSGRFAFHGLDAGEGLTLHFPLHQVVGGTFDGRHSFEVTSPASGLRVDLTAAPMITGRPVGHDGVLAVHAVVTPRVGAQWIARARHRGGPEFHIVLRDGEARQAEVSITRLDGSRFARRLVVAGLDGLVDLGDIPADPLRLLPVHVTGLKGNIEGARVATAGYVSAPTGKDGWVDFRVPVGEPTIVVGKAGYHVAEMRVPPVERGGVEVRLESANALRIVVTGAGAQDRGLRVQIAYSGSDLFERPTRLLRPSTDMRGTPPSRRARDNVTGGGRLLYELVEGGVVVYGVRPDTPLDISLVDAHGHEIVKESVSLGQGQQRTVTWILDERARTLHARVVDDGGRPLFGAEIRIDGRGGTWTSDVEGHAAVEGIFQDRVDVTVSKRGYSTVTRREVALADELAIRLDPVRSLWVTVVDTKGELVDDALLELDGETAGRVRRAGRGLYRIDEVPRRPVVVRARVSERTGTETVAADAERVRIAVR
ncbi:MAG: carboxypeptidase regulatory-like domain-containing protein [Planctomycetes bacterium]|nr:carboxypeptidase regulatory-like domain-containing protein [Planctomycetota bacterium]